MLPLLAAAFLAGGFHESTYSLLAAAVWLGIAVAAARGDLERACRIDPGEPLLVRRGVEACD